MTPSLPLAASAPTDAGARGVAAAPALSTVPWQLLATAQRLAPFGGADSVVTADVPAPEAYVAHLARLGHRPRATTDLVEDLAGAGLAGCGGAHVPVALKWRAAAEATGPLTVVANGAESEPLAGKDGTLLRQRPHLVLDGLALAAEALGASRTVVWLHGDDDGARLAVERALAERAAAGARDHGVEVVAGPSHYLAGEATAITRALEGGPPLPRQTRSYRPEPGGPATLVQNVETLARVALAARGVPAMRTALLTLVTARDRRVVEVERGIPLGDVVAAGGVLPPGLQPVAVLLGGYGGAWASWTAVAGIPVAEASFRAAGLTLGAGVVGLLLPGGCGPATTATIAAYLASMSAAQCGPCLFGLPAVAAATAAVASGTVATGRRGAGRSTQLLRDLGADLDAVRGRGAGRHPDGAVRLVASALDVFADDVAAHLAGRPCAGAGRAHLPVPPGPGTAGRRRGVAR